MFPMFIMAFKQTSMTIAPGLKLSDECYPTTKILKIIDFKDGNNIVGFCHFIIPSISLLENAKLGMNKMRKICTCIVDEHKNVIILHRGASVHYSMI